MSDSYGQLMDRVRDINRLEFVKELLDWDQETVMPPGGVEARAQQIALVAGIAHESLLAEELGKLLEAAEREGAEEGDYVRSTNLREVRRGYDRETKLPTALVKDIALATARGRAAWAEARKDDAFEAFAPHLSRPGRVEAAGGGSSGLRVRPVRRADGRV